MKILGLDLGISSIGWALIETDENKVPQKILGLGSRILPFKRDQISDFDKGKGETPCSVRTAKRRARRTLTRYKMRRKLLSGYLANLNMLPDTQLMVGLSPLEIWGLRAKAATNGERLTLKELGRVLLHINQKRGYKHSRVGSSSKEDTQYVKAVNQRYSEIQEKGLTVGQEVYENLKESEVTSSRGKSMVTAMHKGEVYPRIAYMEELNRILDNQRQYYPETLTDEVVDSLKEAIFFQRPLKSCKHLVSLCEFSAKEFTTKEGRKILIGPKVAPRTSPLAQVCRLYEAINNIRLINLKNKGKKYTPSLFDDEFVPRGARLLQERYELTSEERKRVFDYLTTNEKLTSTELLKLLGLKKSDGFSADKSIINGLKGNYTYLKLKEALQGYEGAEELLKFDLEICDSKKVDVTTGEILPAISDKFIHQPLYRLWHLLYSVSDVEEVKQNLRKQFGIDDECVLERLAALDFTTQGYTNKSAKMMREILPYLMEGYDYTTSCEMAGFNHSFSVSKQQNETRVLKATLTPIPNNSLRQPMIEKVLNQMVNVVNALIERFGVIDEVRVELARNLKSSASERAEMTDRIVDAEKKNKGFAKIISEYNISPTRKRIQKYKLWEETNHHCMYCNLTIKAEEWLNGIDSEVEHIIPRSIFFDDSMSNKTCSCRSCNKAKNNLTAYDFMQTQGKEVLDGYISRVEELFKNKKISKTKRNRLLTTKEEIPTDFLERDMRLTQYISRKACDILRESIRDVWASSGTVTAFLRNLWGYDNIIHDLNLPRFRKADLVKIEEIQYKGNVIRRERIKDWDKRKDHRHHAVDALIVALTRQGYIQPVNNLNAYHTDIYEEMRKAGNLKNGESIITQWCRNLPHFSTSEVSSKVGEIAVSMKGGNKLTVPGKRKIRREGKSRVVQEQLLIPRGPLHEESVYGKLLLPDGFKPLKFAFEFPQLVSDSQLRSIIQERIRDYDGDWNKALKSITKRTPLYHPKSKKPVDSVKCWREEFVMRKKITSLSIKQVPKVVDKKIRTMLEERAKAFANDKSFQSSLIENPLRISQELPPIKSVRLMTGYSEQTMVPSRKDTHQDIIGYSCGGNNHHVAYYINANGKAECLTVSFWSAVNRKMAGLPIIITDAQAAVDSLMSLPDENLRECLAENLPSPDWKFMIKFRISDTFILGLSDEEVEMAFRDNDQKLLAEHLYRVQKASANDIVLRLNFNTSSEIKGEIPEGIFYRLSSYGAIQSLNLKEVKVDITGKISLTS